MTTIAYRDGIMAADSQLTSGSIAVSGNVSKIHFKDGNVFAVSGLWGDTLKILKWFEAGLKGDIPKITDDSQGLLLKADGTFYGLWENQTMVSLDQNEFYAIGSGADIALGAMEMGASAVESVEVGIKRDIYSGGKVVSFKAG